jgi:hypothetical protein
MGWCEMAGQLHVAAAIGEAVMREVAMRVRGNSPLGSV